MLVRLNEVQELYAEFETFKSRCLMASAEHIKNRTENVLNQEDAAILAQRQLIVHSISMFICRQQIQSKFLKPVFTSAWLQPKGTDIENPVQDALEASKSYLNEVFRSVEFGGSK